VRIPRRCRSQRLAAACRLRRRDLVLQSGQAATIEREGALRVDPQRRVVIGNGGIELGHFQEHEAAAVERCGIVRHQPQRLVAVGERLPEDSHYRARPASVVEGRSEIGLELERLIVVVDGVVVLSLPR
jgi:hypothetical protein